jgi:hypothetical protein
MKNIIFSLLLFLISYVPLSAQKSKDALYLKNGSIIYGRLEEVSNDKYKMRTADGSIFIFSASEVDKFAQESPIYEGRKSEGFSFALEAGLLVGAQSTDYDAPFSFNFLLGLRSKTKNIISFGSGVEFIGKPYTPFFIEYKYLTNAKKVAPFIFVRAGALAQIGGDNDPPTNNYDYTPYNYKGGASLAIGSGISWAKDDIETYLSFAYRYAHTSYQQKEYNRGVITYESNLHRLEIKFGFRF